MNQVSPDDPAGASETPQAVVFQRESAAQPPRVTVAITLYNYDRFILDCLESVRLQTISSLDLIVIDDCSRDNSVETTRTWMSRHFHRFRKCQLIRHETNCGLAASRNLAFRRADTEYVFVLDADNSIYPRCAEVLSRALDHCDASFAYGYLEKFGAERGIVSWRPWNARDLPDGNYIDAMTLIRKSAWIQVGGYSTDMQVPGWEDYEFWLKIAEKDGWGVLIPEFLARYRVHLSSMLRTNTNLRMTLIWDYLERRHPSVKRPAHVSECWYRDQDDMMVQCERLRTVLESSGRCSLDVRGWALAQSGVAGVELLVDNRPVGQARYGDLRADLLERAEGYPNGIRCGFSSRLMLPSKVGAGDHSLTMRAMGMSGRIFELQAAFTVDDRSVDDDSNPELVCAEDRLLV
jgi:GT2 family glycosyltransferase